MYIPLMVNISTINEIYKSGVLETLPCFNKETLSTILGRNGEALNYWVKRLIATGEIVSLKNGLYVARPFLLRIKEVPGAMESYREYIAYVLRHPSYLSLEYMLAKYGLITETACALTSLTIKSTRTFANSLSSFMYKNIKPALFLGYREESFKNMRYYVATPAKALFDFFYLKRFGKTDLSYELSEGLRIVWDALDGKDFELLQSYVAQSGSRKMERILEIIIEKGLLS